MEVEGVVEAGASFKLTDLTTKRGAWKEPAGFLDRWAEDLGHSQVEREAWQRAFFARLGGLSDEFSGLFVRLADHEPLLLKPLLLVMDWLPTDFPVHTDLFFRERWRQKPTDLELHETVLNIAGNTWDALNTFRAQGQYHGMDGWRPFACLMPWPLQQLLRRHTHLTALEWTVIAHHLGTWPFEVPLGDSPTPDQYENFAQLPPIPPGPWTTTERLQQVIAQAEARLFPEEKER